MSNSTGLKNAFAWQISNVILFSVFQLAYYAVLARILSKADFGIIAVANVFVSMAVLVSQIGLGPALIQRKDVSQTHIATAFYASIVISVVIYGITYFTAGFFANFYSQPVLKNIIRMLTLSFVFSAIGSTPLSMMQKNMQFNRLFYTEIISALIGMIVGIISAFYGAGVWSLVYGTLSLQFAKVMIAWIFSPVNLFIKLGNKELSQLFHFGFGLTLVRLNNFLSVSGLNFILGKLLPMASLGVFSRSYRIMTLPGRMLGNSIDRVMFPVMSKIQDEKQKINTFYEQTLSFAVSITLTASLWLSLFAKPVVLILLGPNWTDAILPLEILFLALPFRISVRMTDSFIRAKALVYSSAFRKLIYNFILFGLVIYSVSYGLKGIALAVLIAGIFQYFNMIHLARKYTGLQSSIYYKPFLDSIPMALMLFIPSILVTILFNQSSILQMNWITYLEPVMALFVFMVLLPVVVKKWPGMINPHVNQIIAKVFKLHINENK